MNGATLFTDEDRAALVAAVPELGVRLVIDAFAAETGFPADWIIGQRREAVVARVRQRVMFRAWMLGFPYAVIGRALKRDHTTVLHGVKAEAARCGLTMEALRRERDARGKGQHDGHDD
ncbi:helix-turn-helix domain-containing protein [Frigidibacter sp. MR17.24]|uniref:helix-turn-helix domain-containing protein n=1 Tax=Frigidibacter sp. MR17.24 TaxID=3127345 RepID=UPI003012EC9F